MILDIPYILGSWSKYGRIVDIFSPCACDRINERSFRVAVPVRRSQIEEDRQLQPVIMRHGWRP